MKSPFSKKPDPAAHVLQNFIANATWNDKVRVAAATKTGGELELRMRQGKDGTFRFSLWLCFAGDDAGLRLMPAPDETRQ